MKKVLVVAGGDWQIDLVKKIKKLGYYVVCSNLYEDSPAYKYADAHEVCDVLDKDKNLEIAKKYGVNAVLSDQSDIAVPTVAYVNEKMGLRGIGTKIADLLTDKSLMRQYCKDNRIDVPDFKLCKSINDAMEMLDKYKKIIIKPIDSQSSRGVFCIQSKEELEHHIDETISYSNRRKEFLAEEYVGGDEFTIDGLIINGVHYPLCVSIKEMYEQNSNISKIQTYTHNNSIYDYEELKSQNKKLFEQIKMPFGLTHSEYKYYKGKYYLIEAGGRGGGSNLSSKIVPFMSGVDNYFYLIQQALGIDINLPDNMCIDKNKCVIMRFFDFGEGKVKNIYGENILKSNPYMIDYQFKIQKGQLLKNPKYGRLRPGHFIIGGENIDELKRVENEIIESVWIEFE